MVFGAATHDDITANQVEMTDQPGDTTSPGRPSSTREEAPLDGLLLVRQSLLNTGLSEESTDIILASWRDSTKKQYLVYVHKWILFCTKNHIEVFSKDVSCILSFLNVLYDDGLMYSAINTARSALSAFLGVADTDQLGTHPLIVRFMKGIAYSAQI